MLRIFAFLAKSLANIDATHSKITTVYNFWTSVYELVKSLAPAPVAPSVVTPVPVVLPFGWPAGQPVAAVPVAPVPVAPVSESPAPFMAIAVDATPVSELETV